jgi:hypothetical protein
VVAADALHERRVVHVGVVAGEHGEAEVDEVAGRRVQVRDHPEPVVRRHAHAPDLSRQRRHVDCADHVDLGREDLGQAQDGVGAVDVVEPLAQRLDVPARDGGQPQVLPARQQVHQDRGDDQQVHVERNVGDRGGHLRRHLVADEAMPARAYPLHLQDVADGEQADHVAERVAWQRVDVVSRAGARAGAAMHVFFLV